MGRASELGRRLRDGGRRDGGLLEDLRDGKLPGGLHLPWHAADDAPGPANPPPSRELIRFLRDLGVALCRSGAAVNEVGEILDHLARRYGANGMRFLVLPTGVFVRIGDDDGAVMTDFAPADGGALRLDQISRLYDLVGAARTTRLPPEEGSWRLAGILAEGPRFSPAVMVLGHTVLTVGLGMIRDPTAHALVGYAVLGAIIGMLRLLADRFRVLSMALPVVAALTVTILAYKLAGPLSGGDPAQLLIPPLVAMLPGAALTVGTVELAAGSMVAGASRLISGINVLFLLSFGILVGIQVAGTDQHTAHPEQLGWWAPWAGVLLLGAGFYMHFSAPPRSLPWLLVVLYGVWAAQLLGGTLVNGLAGSFLGGLVVSPLAALVQNRRNGPPAQVTFLPSFWLLVPGALGLTGVSELFTNNATSGMADVLNALLTVVAIALGVLVGSSLTQPVPPARPVED